MNHELPKGWIVSTIRNVSGICEQKVPDDDEQFLYVDIGSIDRDLKRIASPQSIQGRNAPSRARKYISTGDVLVSLTRPNLNAVALVTPDFDGQVASTGFEVLRPVLVDSRYLFYLVRTRDFIEKISGLTQGALYPAAKSADVREYQFPLAPLSEQIRIADMLDRVLARVNAAQSRLDKIPALIKRFRQSVLAAATSGELTQEWRDLNVKEGCSTTVLLGDISEVSTGVTPLKSNRSYYENGRIPWLTSSVTGDFYVRKSEKFITSKAVDECRLKLYPPGTLLMAMYGEGKTRGQVTEIKISATVNQACAAIQIISDSVSKEYVRLCLDDNYERTRMMAEGGAQPNLNLKKVRSIPINLPELDEQHEIVRRVESLFALADTVEKQYRDARARTDRLTQAILAKAFRGELVPQNPDDEPAEVLLKRIRQQRAEQATVSNKRNTKTNAAPKKSSDKSKRLHSKDNKVKPAITSGDDLLNLLTELGGEADASALWKKSGLSIDDFYALLKTNDKIEDHNPSSDPAQRKLRVKQ